MSFNRYPHLEKLGNTGVKDIDIGTCHVFAKLDGANASMWNDVANGRYGFGSRNRELSRENDNAGFVSSMLDSQNTTGYFEILGANPNWRLFGEWLVPHTLKDYRDDAWRKFYVFDVFDELKGRFLSYFEYKDKLDYYEVNYIPCQEIVHNGTTEEFWQAAKSARFLLKDGCEVGEGIVIKNYDWTNKFKRQTWAKLINGEFKNKHQTPTEVNENSNEQIIVNSVVTKQLIDKEYAKIIVSEGGWSDKVIPRLLETVFHCVITEELYDGWKKVKYGTINGKALRNFTIQRIKYLIPELF